MIQEQDASFALTARALGALFYFTPDSEQAAPLVAAFRSREWLASWPLPSEVLQPLANGFSQPFDDPLSAAWQRLFIGPDALPASPWGSVWLDREGVLFGDSTLALRQWMRQQAIVFEHEQNEPEDHIGTLLLLAAWLCESRRQTECEQAAGLASSPLVWAFSDGFYPAGSAPVLHCAGQVNFVDPYRLAKPGVHRRSPVI